MYSIREDPYLLCRRGAHAHDWDEVIIGRRTQWGLPEDWRCIRCGMLRLDTIDRLGNISTRRYVKPEGWSDYGPYTTQEIRLEVVRRYRSRT